MSRQLSSTTGTAVSRQTVYRRLGHIDLNVRRPARCLPLTATHCHLWFGSETYSHRAFIWRAPGALYHQVNIIEKHHFGGAGFLV
ncbi:transposable element Tcb1 transposase [Trichonephila clavipes]|nr:transposable element Tcb1 transposase [Trichonephila clavipes]